MKIGRILWGLGFLCVGVVLLLAAFDVISWENVSVWTFLPLILVIPGLTWLFEKNGPKFLGACFILVGGYWVASNLGYMTVSVRKIVLPVLLVAVGISLLFSFGRSASARRRIRPAGDSYVYTDVFCDEKRKVSGDSVFRGANLKAVFGASEYDLTECRIDPAGAYLSAKAVFGGITLLVSEGTQVITTGFLVFGGTSHKHKGQSAGISSAGNGPLTVEVSGAFGGVTIEYR